MTAVQTSDVFTPGKGTTHTYVEREHADAAVDLRKYLRRGGSIVTVIGPTKMGKTVLVGKEAKGAFTAQGQSLQSVDDFWQRLAQYLEIPTATSSSQVNADKSKWGFRAKFGLSGTGA